MRNWKKMLIVVLLVSIGIGFEYGMNPTPVDASPKSGYSIVQKPTDKPKDKPIKIVVHDGGKYCYSPAFTKGEGYVWIDKCTDKTPKARYDVFQRISYYINDTWLCITAPRSVIRGIEPWDYVNLRPCTINDPKQRWIVKENSFWTADGFYRLKDTDWYGYISRNSGDKYNHTLDSSMDDWVKTVATPGNISIQTSIAWDVQTTEGNERYFVRWGGSDKSTTPLYYNPESGHIAQYDPSSGSLYCMSSQVGESDWNWVKWAFCSDAAISKDNPASWNVNWETKEGGIITDYKDNILRVTRFGSNWGIAYTVKPSYLEKDITHFPTSLFIVDKDLLDWTRYTASNLGKTDQYCPAGNQESLRRKRVVRTLPPDFQLTEEWIQRLYAIATSNTQQVSIQEICGTCMLHSFQMLAELQEYHSQGPLQSGGYFFNTAPNTDPSISFRQRYPELNRRITDVPEVYGRISSSTRFYAYGFTRTMLPQYLWNLSNESATPTEIGSHINGLFSNPVGSIWLSISLLQSRSGNLIWHAVPILRTSQGLVVIHTNIRQASLDTYRQSITPLNNPSQVITSLMTGSRSLQRLITIELGHYYQNPLDSMISNNNCTGEGEDRRGTGENPTSTSVNQCASGRCTLISQ
ncbi:PF07598 family protein [Leptospira interrogans serovar Bataviae str. HAI135]|nr:PF07598 family protein [Leptospira interrogans serovar Bataviae str. HAI135]